MKSSSLVLVLALGGLVGAQDSSNLKIDLRVENQPLSVLVERMARQLDVGLVVHADAIDALRRDVSLYARDVDWSEAVRLLRSEYTLALKLAERRLEVASADAEFRRQLERHYYATGVVQRPVRRFQSPRLGVPVEYGERISGGSGVIDLGSGEPPQLIGNLAELVKKSALGWERSWDIDGVELRERSDTLIVRQVPAVHARIEALFDELERNAARQIVVRLFELTASGPYTPVVASELFRELTRGRAPIACFVISDGQHNHHFLGELRQTVEMAESVNHVIDPVVTTLPSGLALDVEGHATRGGVLADVHLQACDARDGRKFEIYDQRGQLLLLNFDLPSLVVDEVQDSRLVPAGGGAIYSARGKTYVVSFEVIAGAQ